MEFKLTKEHAQAVSIYVGPADIQAFVQEHPKEYADYLLQKQNISGVTKPDK